MKPRKKKSDRKKLEDKLEKISKKLVYLRDDYKCQHCGKQDYKDYQASHVIPVSAGKKLKWDLQNMKVLCHHCHLNWWHKNPLEATEWFKSKFPDRYEYLQANKGIKRWEMNELEDLYLTLKLAYDKLIKDRT